MARVGKEAAATATDGPAVESATVWSSKGRKCFGGGSDRYEMEEVLGEGGYGAVYRCRRVRDSASLAVKVIDPQRIGFAGSAGGAGAVEQMALREVDAMRRLVGHPGIVGLEAALRAEDTRQILMVTEFVPGGDLFSHIVRRTEPFQEPEVAHITRQLAEALAFCHAKGVVHRDLKLENILVAGVNVRLMERRSVIFGEHAMVQTEELFTVKICDFGFAKSLQGYTTKTPIGTELYAAPEVPRGCSTSDMHTVGADYDAFKADAYSLGVVSFVLLCLGFPSRDGAESSARVQARHGALSKPCRALLEGLLEASPARRLAVGQVPKHSWLLAQAPLTDEERWAAPRKPQPREGGKAPVKDPALPALLALHRALVMLQRERGMGCWALAASVGLDGVSCLDQFRMHAELTEKRLDDARALLRRAGEQYADGELGALLARVHQGRALVQAQAQVQGQEPTADAFDAVFSCYNAACSGLMEVATSVLEERRGSPEARRAVRHYRLASAAAEQLGRERAFLLGCRRGPGTEPPGGTGGEVPAGVPPGKLRRLGEILGARKVLLGTVAGDDIVTTATGLVGALTSSSAGSEGEGEPPLLGLADIRELEAAEERVMAVEGRDAPSADELYRLLTRALNEVHSRIAIGLVEDLRPTARRDSDDDLNTSERSQKAFLCRVQGCGCRLGLKRLMSALAERL